MSQPRIDAFEAMVKQNPEDPMVWYGLASEYLKLERWADATEALRNVVRVNPDYTAAYQMLGSALKSQGNLAEAREAWLKGIAAADRTGAWKAKQHMERLLAEVAGPEDSAFCS